MFIYFVGAAGEGGRVPYDKRVQRGYYRSRPPAIQYTVVGFSDSDGSMKQKCAQPGNVRISVVEQNLSQASLHAHR
jgi:hypothetical protein